MPEPSSVVVVGASVAGVRVAEELRGAGFAGRVVLVGDEPHLPYDRPPLSKQLLSGEWELPQAHLLDDARLAELDVDLRLGTAAAGLDGLTVRLVDGGAVSGDAVVLATGASARRLPGQPDDERVHVLRSLDDALRLRAAIGDARSLLVVGGGFIGAEVASTARTAGLQVTVVEALAAPFVRALGEQVGAVVGELHTEAGTRLRCGAGVTAWVVGPGGVTVELTDGAQLTADHAVVGAGSVPATEWLRGALHLQADGAVGCDARGRVLDSSGGVVPDLWAVGDVAAWTDLTTGDLERTEHWTRAGEQARLVALELVGQETADDAVPYVWSELYGTTLQVFGRPASGTSLEQLLGEPGEPRGALWAWSRDGLLVGAAGVGTPRPGLRARKVLAAGGTVADLGDLLTPR